MRVEACCQALLGHILPELDPQRQGTCIDVGVGTFAFYCEQFVKQGFATVAVEPIPVKKLTQLCDRQNIKLIEKCLSDRNGVQTLFIGQFGGVLNNNFNSLSSEWFASSGKSKQVETLDLKTLLSHLGFPPLTCLKLDIEGWEPVVLKQFPQLLPEQCPEVVMFEYGGGKLRSKGEGGWSTQFLSGTLDCLSVLQSTGYSLGIMVDYAPKSRVKVFDLQSVAISPAIFYKQAIYGNLIILKNYRYDAETINNWCEPYRKSMVNWIATQLIAR